MNPYLHTAIATGLLFLAFLWGRFKAARVAYMLGKTEGANDIIDVLVDEGTFERDELMDSIARWNRKMEGENS